MNDFRPEKINYICLTLKQNLFGKNRRPFIRHKTPWYVRYL